MDLFEARLVNTAFCEYSVNMAQDRKNTLEEIIDYRYTPVDNMNIFVLPLSGHELCAACIILANSRNITYLRFVSKCMALDVPLFITVIVNLCLPCFYVSDTSWSHS